MTPKTPVTPLPAASVVILRDGPQGLETFMLRRHQGAGIAFSGASVFPGGKVDAGDDDARLCAECPAPADHPAHAFWMAAVRETFEEAGLLLARRRGEQALIDARAADCIVTEGREKSEGFGAVLARAGLVPALDHMIHFAHWITPKPLPRRFDTHFFLLAAPLEQQGNFDQGESAEGGWVRPSEVLAEAEAGRRTLVAVTHFTLELLSTWPTVAAAIAGARTRPVVTVIPTSAQTPEGRIVRVPKEAGYARTELLIREYR